MQIILIEHFPEKTEQNRALFLYDGQGLHPKDGHFKKLTGLIILTILGLMGV